MQRILRLACLGLVGSFAAAVACSSSGNGEGEQTPDGSDASADVVTAPDVETPDVVEGDQVAPPDDAAVDAGPKCKTASCALAIGAGPYHTCALLGDHTVKCWGENTYAELGSGTVAGSKVTPGFSTTPVAVPNLTDAVAIAGGGEASGSAFSCAIRAGGAIRCWGSNVYGQLGGVTDASVSPGGAMVDADASAAAIDLGTRHACMVDTAGALRCWGDNSYGVRGNPALSAVPLPTDAGAATVSAGFFSTCVVSTDGEIVCFGNNTSRQVNPASAAGSSPPNVIDAGAPASAVSAGQLFVCANLDASVSCWGINTGSQLGRSGAFATNPPGSPQFTAGLTPVSVTAGGLHACAIMADHGVSCWGANARGQSGDFTGKSIVATPNGVGGVANVVQLSLGYEHSCALTDDGDIYCWGSNAKGQLGPNGNADAGTDTASHPDPVKVPL